MRHSWETMTAVSAGHIILTPTQPVELFFRARSIPSSYNLALKNSGAILGRNSSRVVRLSLEQNVAAASFYSHFEQSVLLQSMNCIVHAAAADDIPFGKPVHSSNLFFKRDS